MHEILFMIRGRPRNDDIDDETRDEECSLLKKSLSVSRTFGQLGLNRSSHYLILLGYVLKCEKTEYDLKIMSLKNETKEKKGNRKSAI